jgi:predicted RNA-binding protein YlxR (DUF448 family)
MGCQAKRDKQQLLRFVADSRGHVVPDPLGRVPGRGMYLCPVRGCIEKACERKAWARGLRRRVAAPEPASLVATCVAQIERSARALVEAGLADGRAAWSQCGEGIDLGQVLGEQQSGWIAARDPKFGRTLGSLVEQLCRLQQTAR